MEKLMCKKGFKTSYPSKFDYIADQMYFYWNNFQGLNHFVSDKEYSKENVNIIAFDSYVGGVRPYLYDFFYTKEEMRNIKINKILEC